MPTFEQVYTPVADSLLLSTLVAAIPIVVLFVLLAGFRVAAHWSSLVSLGLALVIAVAVYGMPVSLALNSTLMGIAFGLFPIVWIVINAIWIYNLVVDTGQFDVVRNSLASLSNDRRIQVVLIAFILGALLEATAGFGTPVAITAAIMAGLGFEAVYAAALALLANTAPVAFGGFAIPIITGASVAQIDTMALSQMVGRQTPLLALIVPGFLVTVMAGWRRMLEVWPVIVVSGVSFAGAQFVVSNFIGPELADLLAAIVGVVAVVALLAVWSPREEWHFSNEPPAEERETYERPPLGATFLAWSPFIIIIVVFLLSQIGPINNTLKGVESAINFPTAAPNEQGTIAVGWPGLDGQVTRQPPAVAEPGPYPAKYQTNWLTAAGTLILIAGIISLFVLRAGPGRALRIYGQTLNQLKWAILTIAAILGLAYLFNYSGLTYTLGLAFAATGILFPFFASFIGWLGVALTGSDTSSNALFANLQKTTAGQLGLSPVLAVGANSSGGVLGKMISPQNLAVGTSSTGLQGKEGDLFRLVLPWSIVLTVVMAIIVTLQAYVFPWMVPGGG
ncbi:MAG TPA: lactate permease LctP family transporter [Rubrobacteraceae bacterium]|nr:lactate permease LctP family transporter [Rubrobacteraceae bacterium]